MDLLTNFERREEDEWKANEMDTYLQAKEYVDTAIIPLVPISCGDRMKSTVVMGEFILIHFTRIGKTISWQSD